MPGVFTVPGPPKDLMDDGNYEWQAEAWGLARLAETCGRTDCKFSLISLKAQVTEIGSRQDKKKIVVEPLLFLSHSIVNGSGSWSCGS